MINKNFIADTDKLIELCKTRAKVIENGNLLIAAVHLDNIKNGILLPSTYSDREEYKRGFGRVLMLPAEYAGKAKVGDYVVYPFEARLPFNKEVSREILGVETIDNFLSFIQDNDIILPIEQGIMHGNE